MRIILLWINLPWGLSILVWIIRVLKEKLELIYRTYNLIITVKKEAIVCNFIVLLGILMIYIINNKNKNNVMSEKILWILRL